MNRCPTVPGNLASWTPGKSVDAGGRELRLLTEKRFPGPCPAATRVGEEARARSNDIQSVCDKLTSMSSQDSNSHVYQPAEEQTVASQIRDIAEVPAIEVITTAAVHLMSAAAVKLGLADDVNAAELKDLDEARKLITALAGLVTAAAPEIGSQHAGPLRDGLRSLQLAFREESSIQDAPGKGPGEKFTGAVN